MWGSHRVILSFRTGVLAGEESAVRRAAQISRAKKLSLPIFF
jgi:hypothetical protein